MAGIGRPRTCECGTCRKCKRRETARARWQALSIEEKREVIARRDREIVRANDRLRYERDKEKRLALMRRVQESWRERHPDRRKAHNAVSNAIRDGRLVRRPCEVCGSDRTHAHHDDYSKPLDVRWLCPAHHGDVHRSLRNAA